MLFDSHCHFSFPQYDDIRTELAKQIKSSDLTYIMDIGTDLESSKRCARAAAEYEFCFATTGYHPSEVDGLTEDILAECMALYNLPKVQAIGEIGLDYHYDDAPSRKTQQHWFRRQLQEAVRLGAPVCIHSRDADADMMQILKEEIFEKKIKNPDNMSETITAGKRVRVLMHCFSGSAELARQYVKLGAKISMAGPITFKNARRNVEVIEAIDLKDLLIETDSPYLSPEPHRGEMNMPQYVEFVARKIAEIKGLSYKEVAEQTFKNACEFYGIKHRMG